VTLLKRFLDFYVNSSIHVALAVLSFCFLTAFELDINLSMKFYVSIFCASVAGYNFVKYFGVAKFHYRSLTTKLKYIQLVSLLSVIVLTYTSFMLRIESQLLLGFLAIITFLYAIPPGIKAPNNIRSIGGVKIYVVSVVWVVTSVVLPLLETQQLLVLDHFLMGVQRIFILVVLMLPFEIRDLERDEDALSTIPQKIGVQNTKILGCALLLDSLILEFLKQQSREGCFLALILASLILAVFLLLSHPHRSRYYTALFVESVPIIWVVLTLLTA
jgi:hypothetical protein